MDEKIIKQFKEILNSALKNQDARFEKIFTTKADLRTLENRFEKKFTTKEDLATFEKRIENKFVTKDDFKSGLEKLFTDIVETFDKHKADKINLTALEKRVEKVEESIKY